MINSRWIRLFTPLILLFLFGWLFLSEIRNILGWIEYAVPLTPEEIDRSYEVLEFNGRWFLFFLLMWLMMVAAQAIFPVVRVREWLLTAWYFLNHIFGLHGMAGYIRNGEVAADVRELERSRLGAMIVDFNSAVVIERQVVGLIPRLASFVLRLPAILMRTPLPPVRVCGTGMMFTLPDERIHGVNDLAGYPGALSDPNWVERIIGVVDLRAQFRTSGYQPHKLSKRLGAKVSAYTRDGMEVQTDVWVVATIGQEPVPYFPLNVLYEGEQHPRNLRVGAFKRVSPRTDLFRLQSIEDSLDPYDRLEIHEQLQSVMNWVPYGDPPSHPLLPSFSAERVFCAVYARARHHLGLERADEIIPWADLTIHVAIDVFRELVSHHNYDELYQSDADGNLRIAALRSKLGYHMRNKGLLAYRPVLHADGKCLKPGRLYHSATLRTVHPNNTFILRRSQILRDRGIRVIAAGFGTLAVDNKVYRQRFDNWRANWDQETMVKEAGYDAEASRTRAKARIRAQQDFLQNFSEIYRSSGNSREILTLRVLQALEEVAADPKTRELLPDEAFSLLRSVHDWILPGDAGSNPGPQ